MLIFSARCHSAACIPRVVVSLPAFNTFAFKHLTQLFESTTPTGEVRASYPSRLTRSLFPGVPPLPATITGPNIRRAEDDVLDWFLSGAEGPSWRRSRDAHGNPIHRPL